MWICLICTLLTVYKRPIVIPIIMIRVPSMSDMIIDGAIFRMGLAAIPRFNRTMVRSLRFDSEKSDRYRGLARSAQ